VEQALRLPLREPVAQATSAVLLLAVAGVEEA
jgi:hypothetical protein